MFDNVLGQESVRQLFKSILENNRLAHSYLFMGPGGVGKFLFARTLARTLLCERKDGSCIGAGSQPGQGGNMASGVTELSCKSCRQVEHLTHPSLRVLEVPAGKKNISIDDIRELEREIALKPFMGTYKLFIINNADMLSEDAVNALLKTLEEPPPYSLLILVSARPEKLPATVRSRCHSVRFHPLAGEILVRIFQGQLGLTEKEAQVLSIIAEGSVGTGIQLSQGAFLQQGDALVKRLFKRDGVIIDNVINFARQDNNSNEEVRQRIILQFKILAFFLRDALLAHWGVNDYYINRNKKDLVAHLKDRLSPERLERIIDNLLTAEQYLRMNLNMKLVVANALLN